MSSPVAPQVAALIQITAKESWGRTPPQLGVEFRFPLVVGGLAYIARFSVSDGDAFSRGMPIEVPIEFMFPDKALPRFTPGTQFTIWDGKDIGTGKVLRLVDTSNKSLERTREG